MSNLTDLANALATLRKANGDVQAKQNTLDAELRKLAHDTRLFEQAVGHFETYVEQRAQAMCQELYEKKEEELKRNVIFGEAKIKNLQKRIEVREEMIAAQDNEIKTKDELLKDIDALQETLSKLNVQYATIPMKQVLSNSTLTGEEKQSHFKAVAQVRNNPNGLEDMKASDRLRLLRSVARGNL